MTETESGAPEQRTFEVAGSLTAHCVIPPHPRAVVVLLHGIPSAGPRDPADEGYAGLARHLARRSFASAWADLRGVRGAPGFFSIEGWVEDARSLVDAARGLAGDRPVAVVGSSAGGAVALEVAARGAPVVAVACLGTPAEWGSYASNGKEGIERIERDAGMPVAGAAKAAPDEWAAEFDRVTARSSIARVSVPVLIVHGTADDVVPVAHATLLGHASRLARVEILQGAGHQLRREPAAVDLVSEWLEEVTP